ncbi:response regulator transcription factor [Pseudobacteroides cellulosolvens]|uniref:response regulator transcription factor n=1 Tax=Pseudobacteroides cellulosolvens TaxID=35825 RepID=UPI00055D27CC|nr:response regulator transcription factor [Pseudobacteroides cellulosolvens]
MNKIKMIIVEDDEKWVMALNLFLELEPDFEVTAVAGDYDKAIEICTSTDADIILMDINLSGNELDGIYATAEILCHKDVKVIMLTAMSDREIIQNAYIAGAVNYILKNNYKDIPSIIRSTLKSSTPNEVLAKDYQRLRINELLYPLTTQEKEIFKMFTEGKSKKDVLECLYISDNTLKNHIHSIIRKLESKTIHDAVEKIKRKGFLKKEYLCKSNSQK